MLRIGLISDTHGKLDPRVAEVFEGVDRIIHAGDICSPYLLMELEVIAPVTAVKGNCDTVGEEARLPVVARLTLEGVRIMVVHDRSDIPGVPDGADVVVFGHSHRPLIQELGDTLWINPGSSQQARGAAIGTSVAILEVHSGSADARIVPLSEIVDAG